MLETTSSVDAHARIEQLESLLSQRTAEIEARDLRIRLLEEALRVLKADKYGASREKLGQAPAQRGLFNEVEATIELTEMVGVEPPLSATPLRETRSSDIKAGRKALAMHLPRIEIRHEIPAIERVCACGAALQEIGAETSEQLDYVPAKVQVIRHVRPKYACACCHSDVKIAPVPVHVLPRSNAAPGLLAHLITAKYVDSLPLHRQETIFARHGVSLPRATQAAWIIAVAQQLQPLVNLMDERLRASGYVRIDETPVQVLNSEKSAGSEHWMWVRVAGPPGQRLILFDYDASRGAQVAERLLDGASGYVHSDGYAVYDGVAVRLDLTHLGCMAHARRRFFEAIQALPKPEQQRETAAHQIVRRIDALYAIERQIKALSDEARVVERQKRAVPLLAALHALARSLEQQTLPSGKLGEALAYLLKQWPKLIRYVEDGRLAIDTNLAENAIRPFALGRRNWLFADTVKGAKASASLYGIVETAKANGLEPYAYLRKLLEQLPHAKTVADFEALLPFATLDA
ncbi:MAG TPA: IS66 family transposase [Steroidobacteraceae bacterium]